MLVEVEFLFDNQLIAGVEQLIRNAKRQLLLISPYIDLDARIMDALNERKEIVDFELFVLFGKNEYNYKKSLKRDSLQFLKQFPNVEIRYNERLHAKYYENDFEFIMTSLNLYDYSLANNIEVGARGAYASKGFLGKAMDVTNGIVGLGIDKVRHDVLGINKDIHPVDKFHLIFETSDIVYQTKAIVEEKTGLIGLISKKKLLGFDVLINKLDNISTTKENNLQPIETISTTITTTTQTTITEIRCVSATQIAKNYKTQARDIVSIMESKGYIKNDRITEAGKLKGLVLKSYMGNEYIAYPENLDEFKELSR